MTAAGSLLRRVGGHRRWVAVSVALGIITTGAGIGLIALAAHLLQQSAFAGAAVTLSFVILGVRFFAITRVVARYCDRYVGHLGTFRVLTRLRVWLFRSLIPAGPMMLVDRSRGDIVTGLIDDVDTMQDHLLRVSVPPLVALGALVVGSVSIGAIHPALSIILISAFVTAGLLLPAISGHLSRVAAAELVTIRALRQSLITEGLAAIDELTIWGRTGDLIDEVTESDQQEALARRRVAISRSLTDSAIMVLVGACALTTIAIVPSLDIRGGQRWWIASIPLIVVATFEVLGPLVMSREAAGRTDAAARRLLEIADLPTDSPESMANEQSASPIEHDHPADSDLVIDHVSFGHRGGPLVLDDISLIVPSGSTVAIAARTGEGKSTFVALLLGFLRPDVGSISIGGLDVSRLDVSRLDVSRLVGDGRATTSIAAVLQDDHLFDTTVRDNLLVADGDATDDRLLAACTIAGLDEFIDTREGGLDAPVGPAGELLSGGERQRLMIARALVADAPILLLDEATEHLEAALRSQIIDAILESRSGRTTIVLAHDDTARIRADIVVKIVDGSVVIDQR